MKLYNTLSKKIEKIEPLDKNSLRVYSCGPTVYNHIHIGNLASFVFADTLRRTLSASDYEVRQVMNFTDVDDKTIKASHQKYPKLEPRAALEKLTSDYSALFLQDMKKIGNDINAVTFVRATDHIEAMKQLITGLLENGFAYITDDGVYFSIENYRRSGKIYGQLLNITAENTSRARVDNDEYDKDNVHDWALWKVQKRGEPAWNFSYKGKNINGRPGWHLECSSLSRQILGQPFDIHTGGIDLIFPHHENEIAQSTAGEKNSKFASIFAHNEHMLIDGKKMSKSLNNFFVLEDVIKKGFDPLAFRLLILQSHYRSSTQFSWQNLTAAQNRLDNYQQMADLRWQTMTKLPKTPISFESSYQKILTALQNDLNTPAALVILSQDVEDRLLSLGCLPKKNLAEFTEFLEKIDALFGLGLLGSEDINADQKQLLEKRRLARESSDWRTSDEIRDQLANQHIFINDTPHGQVWHRQTVL